MDEEPSDLFLGPPDITLKIVELNPNLTCYVCKGYLRDAATITECLHSFCKRCIVKHFMESIQCPRCRILVHPTDPLVNLRPDHTLTDIVNKILPHIQEDERKREVEFYTSRNLPVPLKESPSTKADVNSRQQIRDCHDDLVSLVLEYIGEAEDLEEYQPIMKNFVRVSGNATIGHVQKFISRRMQLDMFCHVFLFYATSLLDENLTLHETQRIFDRRQEELLQLSYAIATQ